MVPCQDNTYDCGIFMLIFLLHFMMMAGINDFSNLGNNITPEQCKILYCDAENVWNLRRYILQLILEDCTIEPKTICMFFFALYYIVTDYNISL